MKHSECSRVRTGWDGSGSPTTHGQMLQATVDRAEGEDAVFSAPISGTGLR